MFFLDTRESKNKNIKKTKNGKYMIIPITETTGFGKGIVATPINSQITKAVKRQFLLNFFKLSIKSTIKK
ncbi:hypothetical protein ES703_39133 [subsurface metagenome]